MAGSLPALNNFNPRPRTTRQEHKAGSRKRNQRHLATAPRVSFQQHLAPLDTRPHDKNSREMIGKGKRASGVWSERKRPLPCTSGIKPAKGNPNPMSAADRRPRADPRDRGSSGHDERNGRPSRASPIQMTGSGTPGEEAPKAHDPQMGNGPLNCSHARSLAPAVLKPYVRLASNKDQRCVSRARPATCSRESSPLTRESTRSRSRPTDRGERGQANEPFERPKSARATLAIKQRHSPVQRRTRGDERNSRSGTAVSRAGNRDTHARDATTSAEGK